MSQTSLDDTCIGRHVGEKHERNTSCKETGTSTDLEPPVTKDIVGETDTGAELDTGVGPFASVNVASAVINGKGRIVGHDIIVIERQIVHAKAIGQFELVIDVPFILGICTDLIETDPCRRILVSVEAPVISHCHRSLSIIEITQAGELESTGSITHVCIESHLGLEAELPCTT